MRRELCCMGNNVFHEWYALPSPGLKVLMVGGRGSAMRAIIENHEVSAQPVLCLLHDGQNALKCLWLMAGGDNRVVFF